MASRMGALLHREPAAPSTPPDAPDAPDADAATKTEPVVIDDAAAAAAADDEKNAVVVVAARPPPVAAEGVGKPIEYGDLVIVYEGFNKAKAVTIAPRAQYQNKYGNFFHVDWVGKPLGSKVFGRGENGGHVWLLAPTPELRAAAAAWTPAVATATVAGHHQRLETTVLAEPVSKMCFSAAARIAAAYYADARGRAGRAYYEAVCLGTLLPDALLAADAEAGFEANPALLLASDRFNRSAYARWRAHGRVVASDAPPSDRTESTDAVDDARASAPRVSSSPPSPPPPAPPSPSAAEATDTDRGVSSSARGSDRGSAGALAASDSAPGVSPSRPSILVLSEA